MSEKRRQNKMALQPRFLGLQTGNQHLGSLLAGAAVFAVRRLLVIRAWSVKKFLQGDGSHD